MDVFGLRERLVDDYEEYTRSFITLRDATCSAAFCVGKGPEAGTGRTLNLCHGFPNDQGPVRYEQAVA